MEPLFVNFWIHHWLVFVLPETHPILLDNNFPPLLEIRLKLPVEPDMIVGVCSIAGAGPMKSVKSPSQERLAYFSDFAHIVPTANEQFILFPHAEIAIPHSCTIVLNRTK